VDGFTAGFPTAWALAIGARGARGGDDERRAAPAKHGFPARLIVPGLYGYVSATKWLSEIELTTLGGLRRVLGPARLGQEAPILTQSRIDVPRIRARLPRDDAVAGVAWAPDRGHHRGRGAGRRRGWQPAEISTPISDATWVQFVYRWQAEPGEHRIRVRATDGDGRGPDRRADAPAAPDGARGHHTSP
jgi:DMSO/TMAO reductase YedYZ molybdopterin-dependent catalytic subunit